MALQKDIMTQKGPTTYHKITKFDMNCMAKKVRMTISFFANEEVRNMPEGRATFNKEYFIENDEKASKFEFDEYFSDDVLLETQISPLKMGYKYILDTDDIFDGATFV